MAKNKSNKIICPYCGKSYNANRFGYSHLEGTLICADCLAVETHNIYLSKIQKQLSDFICALDTYIIVSERLKDYLQQTLTVFDNCGEDFYSDSEE